MADITNPYHAQISGGRHKHDAGNLSQQIDPLECGLGAIGWDETEPSSFAQQVNQRSDGAVSRLSGALREISRLTTSVMGHETREGATKSAGRLVVKVGEAKQAYSAMRRVMRDEYKAIRREIPAEAEDDAFLHHAEAAKDSFNRDGAAREAMVEMLRHAVSIAEEFGIETRGLGRGLEEGPPPGTRSRSA